MEDEMFEKLQQVMKEINPAVKTLSKDSNLQGELKLDSLDTINFFFEVEKAFGITISEADITGNKLTQIDNLLKYLDQKTNVNIR